MLKNPNILIFELTIGKQHSSHVTPKHYSHLNLAFQLRQKRTFPSMENLTFFRSHTKLKKKSMIILKSFKFILHLKQNQAEKAVTRCNVQ